MTILETSGLTRRFGSLKAVDGLNLSVAEGEVFGLLGPNGAGKTTVIKMLTTLLPPTAGTATVAGFDIRQRPAQVRASIGYVPQLISVDGALTGYENLLFFAKLYGVPEREAEPHCGGAGVRGTAGSRRPAGAELFRRDGAAAGTGHGHAASAAGAVSGRADGGAGPAGAAGGVATSAAAGARISA